MTTLFEFLRYGGESHRGTKRERTLAVTVGPWGGVWFTGKRGLLWRLCLGFVAITYVPAEMTQILERWIDDEHNGLDCTAVEGRVTSLLDAFEAAESDVRALVNTGDWYIACLENVIAKKVVRGLDEAAHGWDKARTDAVKGLAGSA